MFNQLSLTLIHVISLNSLVPKFCCYFYSATNNIFIVQGIAVLYCSYASCACSLINTYAIEGLATLTCFSIPDRVHIQALEKSHAPQNTKWLVVERNGLKFGLQG